MAGPLVVDAGDTLIQASWVQEVRAILADADASAWRAERAEELRRRVTDVVAALRQRLRERASRSSSAALDAGRVARTQALVTTMESALPTEPTRASWAAFVGVVHPEYEALVDALPRSVAPAAPSVRPTNYARSLFHGASAAVGLTSVALIPSKAVILGIALAFAGYAWSMEAGRRLSPRMNDWLMRMYGRVSHPHERYKVNSATWYATALVLLALFSSRPATMAALAVLGAADPVAALVGRRWGTHKLRADRSLEGTLAFVVTGTLVAAGALGWAGGLSAGAIAAYALLAGGAGALAELFASRIDDNLTIPVAVGGTLTAVAALVS